MLEPIRHILQRQRNILASGSERRKQILVSIGVDFESISSNFAENLPKESFSHPIEYVKENAKQKAINVWNQLSTNGQKPDLIIGCDTVVTIDDTIFEKPKDKEEAIQILSRLSATKHTVFTGVALVTSAHNNNNNAIAGDCGPSQAEASGGGKEGSGGGGGREDYVVTTFHEGTDVYMTEMNEQIIKAYVQTGEPMDKAGAYGIQGIGATLVESIKGDYFNVVGLPVHRLCKELYHMYIE